jgi:hypothetical protein
MVSLLNHLKAIIFTNSMFRSLRLVDFDFCNDLYCGTSKPIQKVRSNRSQSDYDSTVLLVQLLMSVVNGSKFINKSFRKSKNCIVVALDKIFVMGFPKTF